MLASTNAFCFVSGDIEANRNRMGEKANMGRRLCAVYCHKSQLSITMVCGEPVTVNTRK